MTISDNLANSDSNSFDAENFIYKSSHHSAAADVIEFHGVKTTRIDALKKEVTEIFRANNLRQLMQNSGKAALHMMVQRYHEEMGLFEECQAVIDTAPGNNKGNYVVKFFAKEIRNPFKMNIKMEMQTSGETDAGLSAKKANIFGRGETAELTFSKGLRRDGGLSFGFSAWKPLLGWQRYENMNTQIHKRTDFLRWNRTDVHENAASFIFNKLYPKSGFMSSFGFNSNWRLFLPRNDTPFPIREQSGHTTKFSFEHTLLADWRDRHILPTNGSLLKLRLEYAPGIVGDSAFMKGIFDFQTAAPLPGGFFCGASFRLASVHSVANRSIHLLDRLYLGGPFDVRGYELNSIGSTIENCSLGGSALLSTAFHLYAPLYPREMFFAHCFVSTGSLSSIRSKQRLHDLWQLQRVSAGIGLAVNLLNMVRLELNYTVPLRKFPGDVYSHGIQFGAGLNFM